MQEGSIMSIDTPSGIIEAHKKPLASIRTSDMFKLVKDLQGMQDCHSAYRFGAEVHYTPQGRDLDIQALEENLSHIGHNDIVIAAINPEIEDCFMELMKKD